jgi:hypothetical protein
MRFGSTTSAAFGATGGEDEATTVEVGRVDAPPFTGRSVGFALLSARSRWAAATGAFVAFAGAAGREDVFRGFAAGFAGGEGERVERAVDCATVARVAR